MEKLQSSIDLHFRELESLISPWHSKLETAQKGIPPHITLLWPWKEAPLKHTDIETLKHVLKDIQTFSVTFNKIEQFQNGTIFLACENTEYIQSIMKTIFDTFPECKPYNGEFMNPTPHLTIAQVSDQSTISQVYDEICTKLKPVLPLTYLVDEIVIMEELETKDWKITETIKLQNTKLSEYKK